MCCSLSLFLLDVGVLRERTLINALLMSHIYAYRFGTTPKLLWGREGLVMTPKGIDFVLELELELSIYH